MFIFGNVIFLSAPKEEMSSVVANQQQSNVSRWIESMMIKTYPKYHITKTKAAEGKSCFDILMGKSGVVHGIKEYKDNQTVYYLDTEKLCSIFQTSLAKVQEWKVMCDVTFKADMDQYKKEYIKPIADIIKKSKAKNKEANPLTEEEQRKIEEAQSHEPEYVWFDLTTGYINAEYMIDCFFAVIDDLSFFRKAVTSLVFSQLSDTKLTSVDPPKASQQIDVEDATHTVKPIDFLKPQKKAKAVGDKQKALVISNAKDKLMMKAYPIEKIDDKTAAAINISKDVPMKEHASNVCNIISSVCGQEGCCKELKSTIFVFEENYKFNGETFNLKEAACSINQYFEELPDTEAQAEEQPAQEPTLEERVEGKAKKTQKKKKTVKKPELKKLDEEDEVELPVKKTVLPLSDLKIVDLDAAEKLVFSDDEEDDLKPVPESCKKSVEVEPVVDPIPAPEEVVEQVKEEPELPQVVRKTKTAKRSKKAATKK